MGGPNLKKVVSQCSITMYVSNIVQLYLSLGKHEYLNKNCNGLLTNSTYDPVQYTFSKLNKVYTITHGHKHVHTRTHAYIHSFISSIHLSVIMVTHIEAMTLCCILQSIVLYQCILDFYFLSYISFCFAMALYVFHQMSSFKYTVDIFRHLFFIFT